MDLKERLESFTDSQMVGLIQAIFEPDYDDLEDIDLENLPELTPEEKAALDAMPDDFIDRIIAGEMG